jgi:hypothetical protein
MTKLWGPLGWMTLHSVSLIYPEEPTEAEKIIANRFLVLFSETISCITCKNHFKIILTFYRFMKPNFLNSRQEFALFVFRAHNTVNKRIDKPRPSTVSECLASLRNATSQTSFAEFRKSYIAYLYRNSRGDFTGDGMMNKSSIKEMEKINNEYWSLREIPIPELKEDDVLSPIEKHDFRISPAGNISSVKVGFAGGRLRLTKR